MLYKICKILLLLIARPYFRVRIIGTGNIPKEGGVLFVSNHASFLDPPLIGMCVSRDVNYMAKEELFQNPVISWILRRIHAHPIKRGGADRKGIQYCRKILQKGGALAVFPEGTRTRDGRIGEMKPGSVMMISGMPDVSVVPVYVRGTYEALPRGRYFPRPARVSIRFGAPFKIPQKGVAIDKKSYYKTISIRFHDAIQSLKNSGKSEFRE